MQIMTDFLKTKFNILASQVSKATIVTLHHTLVDIICGPDS